MVIAHNLLLKLQSFYKAHLQLVTNQHTDAVESNSASALSQNNSCKDKKPLKKSEILMLVKCIEHDA